MAEEAISLELTAVLVAILLLGALWVLPVCRQYQAEVLRRQTKPDPEAGNAGGEASLIGLCQQHVMHAMRPSEDLLWSGHYKLPPLHQQLSMVTIMTAGPVSFLAMGVSGAITTERKLIMLTVLLVLSELVWLRMLFQAKHKLSRHINNVIGYALTTEGALVLRIALGPAPFTEQSLRVSFAQMTHLREENGTIIFYEKTGSVWELDCLDFSRQTTSRGFKCIGEESSEVVQMIRNQRRAAQGASTGGAAAQGQQQANAPRGFMTVTANGVVPVSDAGFAVRPRQEDSAAVVPDFVDHTGRATRSSANRWRSMLACVVVMLCLPEDGADV